ncbi:porin family protein [Mariniflexile ostreae]|uniref:Porin family protein n=1 Tax=Mariniflexile ostreae TaxID=1520892 RepID=A0ABV5F922_9FLAO
MKNTVFFIVFSICFLSSFAQDSLVKDVDSLYKEDQFYAGVTYNLLGKKPHEVSQTGFSTGFYFGFIKDMPLNSRRNMAIGVGLGYATNSFNQNMLIYKDASNKPVYTILTDVSGHYKRNKFSTHVVELPIEFRWRTSTASDYDFWRIYTGFKLGYMFSHAAKYRGSLGDFKYRDIADFNNFQYGLTLSAGYSTWNFHFYYGLNTILNSHASLNGSPIDMNELKIGLMFYIL